MGRSINNQIFFPENTHPGKEKRFLPKTIDRDELEFDGPPSPICYFLVGGNENGLFILDPQEHILMVLIFKICTNNLNQL